MFVIHHLTSDIIYNLWQSSIAPHAISVQTYLSLSYTQEDALEDVPLLTEQRSCWPINQRSPTPKRVFIRVSQVPFSLKKGKVRQNIGWLSDALFPISSLPSGRNMRFCNSYHCRSWSFRSLVARRDSSTHPGAVDEWLATGGRV